MQTCQGKRQLTASAEANRLRAANAQQEIREHEEAIRLRRTSIVQLYYIAHVENLVSIINRGILSHDASRRLSQRPRNIAMDEVQDRRDGKWIMGQRLHSYANLYFNPINAMMYVRRDRHRELCVIGVSCSVLDLPKVVITDGNAANSPTRHEWSPAGLLRVDWEVIEAQRWNHFSKPTEPEYGKRARMAEVLVPQQVPPRYIECVYVSCLSSRELLESVARDACKDIDIQVRPEFFFQDW